MIFLIIFGSFLIAFLIVVIQISHINSNKDIPEISFPVKSIFSVSDYLERMEKIACEQDNTFIPVELWWGYDGWRQKPDGTFERVTRWKPEAININPYHVSLAFQSKNSDIQNLNQRNFQYQLQNAQIQQNMAFINSMCNYSIPMPEYIKNSCINSYMQDLTRCCCDFHSYFD